MTDDLRRALARYADTTPYLDPKDGLAARLARRERRRRALAAGTAAVALLVVGTSVVALGRDRGTAGLVAAPTPEPSSAAPEETPSATMIGPEPATVPPSSPASRPSEAPSATTIPPPPLPPAPPAEPIVRTASGQDGMRLRVTLTPGGVPTGTPARLRVEGWDDDGALRVDSIEWGDGLHESIGVGMPGCAEHTAPPPSPRVKSPGELDETFTHVWRHPGRYTMRVTLASQFTCEQDPPPDETASVTFAFDVPPGEELSNGPRRPRGDFEVSVPDEERPREKVLFTALHDPDGYVATATLDWGDGNAPLVLRNDEPCRDGDGRHYPADGYFTVERKHTYAPGDYTVTLTTTSAGCDGKNPQTVTETRRLRVD